MATRRGLRLHDGTWWLHDGITMASRRRVAFLRPSDIFVCPSCCIRGPMAPMFTRTQHDLTRCPHDGLTNGKMDTRIPHENEHFCQAHEVAPEA